MTYTGVPCFLNRSRTEADGPFLHVQYQNQGTSMEVDVGKGVLARLEQPNENISLPSMQLICKTP